MLLRGAISALIVGRDRMPSLLHLQEESSSSAEKSQNGWRLFSAKQGGDAECATKWEQSKQKGNMGYYFAHHTSLKELAPEDYQMNGPRLLSKGALRSKVKTHLLYDRMKVHYNGAVLDQRCIMVQTNNEYCTLPAGPT